MCQLPHVIHPTICKIMRLPDIEKKIKKKLFFYFFFNMCCLKISKNISITCSGSGYTPAVFCFASNCINSRALSELWNSCTESIRSCTSSWTRGASKMRPLVRKSSQIVYQSEFAGLATAALELGCCSCHRYFFKMAMYVCTLGLNPFLFLYLNQLRLMCYYLNLNLCVTVIWSTNRQLMVLSRCTNSSVNRVVKKKIDSAHTSYFH